MAEFDSVIPPGGQGKVVAKVHTKGQQGRRTKTIAVETDDPEKPHVTLRLSFEARPLIMVLPRSSVFLTAVQGRDAETTLLLRRGDGEPLTIEAAEATRPGIEVTLEKVTAEQPAEGPLPAAKPGDWKIRLRLPGSEAPRAETGRLRILTDHPQQRELSLPLRLQVRAAIEASPKALALRWRGAQPPPPAAVIVRHNAHRRFRLDSVELEGDLPGLSARIAGSDPAPVQRVEIVAQRTDAEPGTHRGVLLIRTRAKKLPPLRVPITLEIAPRGDASAAGGL